MKKLTPRVLKIEQRENGEFRTIYIDDKGRECVWCGDGYYLLKKDGTVGKRRTTEY